MPVGEPSWADYTAFLESVRDVSALERGLLESGFSPPSVWVVLPGARDALPALRRSGAREILVVDGKEEGPNEPDPLGQLRSEWVVIFPDEMTLNTLKWPSIPRSATSVTPLVPCYDLPARLAERALPAVRGWVISRELVLGEGATVKSLPETIERIVGAAETAPNIAWGSAGFGRAPLPGGRAPGLCGLPASASVCVLVPHLGCERWLPQCLASLTRQTRSPQAVVVIHDGPSSPPVRVVEGFPSVTLLASHERVGPFRLNQSFIDRSGFDAYMFQDADDWSSDDRLACLLREADACQADVVGSQELTVGPTGSVVPGLYPRDVNAALEQKPGHPLLHATSLVSSRLIRAVGGFSTGFQFAADSDFVFRASFAGRVVNSGRHCYFRRTREGSLTTHPDTGNGSAAREAIASRVNSRMRAMIAARSRGERPPLGPDHVLPAVELRHLAGPSHPLALRR